MSVNDRKPRPGTRLPSLSLPRISSGEPIEWRLPRGVRVLVFLGAELTRDTGAYLDALREWRGRFRVWDGRPLIVLTSGRAPRDLDPENVPYPVVADPDGEGRARCGVRPEELAVIITDRWGEVYRSWVAAEPSDLPGPEEIEEWLRFIVTQCPECGVPDEAPEPT